MMRPPVPLRCKGGYDIGSPSGLGSSLWPRWSSSGHDKCIHDNEFTGRLDFNQYTRETVPSDVLLLYNSGAGIVYPF